MILRTLVEVNWNRKQAAQRLDICYKSLLIKLRRWHLGRRRKTRVGREAGKSLGERPDTGRAKHFLEAKASGGTSE